MSIAASPALAASSAASRRSSAGSLYGTNATPSPRAEPAIVYKKSLLVAYYNLCTIGLEEDDVDRERTALCDYVREIYHVGLAAHQQILEKVERINQPPIYLKVEVIKGEDLSPRDVNDENQVNPFIVAGLSHKHKMKRSRSGRGRFRLYSAMKRLREEYRQESRAIARTMQPNWQHTFFFPIADIKSDILLLDVWNKDVSAPTGKVDKKDFIGVLNLSLHNARAESQPRWYSLMGRSRPLFTREKKVSGRLLLSIKLSRRLLTCSEFGSLLLRMLKHECEVYVSSLTDPPRAGPMLPQWSGVLRPQPSHLLRESVIQSGLERLEYTIHILHTYLQLSREGRGGLCSFSWSKVFKVQMMSLCEAWLDYLSRLEQKARQNESFAQAQEEVAMEQGIMPVLTETVHRVIKSVSRMHAEFENTEEGVADLRGALSVLSYITSTWPERFCEKEIMKRVSLAVTKSVVAFNKEERKKVEVAAGKENKSRFFRMSELAKFALKECRYLDDFFGKVFGMLGVKVAKVAYCEYLKLLYEDYTELEIQNAIAFIINQNLASGVLIQHSRMTPDILKMGKVVEEAIEPMSVLTEKQRDMIRESLLSFLTLRSFLKWEKELLEHGENLNRKFNIKSIYIDFRNIVTTWYILELYQDYMIMQKSVRSSLAMNNVYGNLGFSECALDTVHMLQHLFSNYWEILDWPKSDKATYALLAKTTMEGVAYLSVAFCVEMFKLLRHEAEQQTGPGKRFVPSHRYCMAINNMDYMSTQAPEFYIQLRSSNNTLELLLKEMKQNLFHKISIMLANSVRQTSVNIKIQMAGLLTKMNTANLTRSAEKVLEEEFWPYITEVLEAAYNNLNTEMYKSVMSDLWTTVILEFRTTMLDAGKQYDTRYWKRLLDGLVLTGLLFHGDGRGLDKTDLKNQEYVKLQTIIKEKLGIPVKNVNVSSVPVATRANYKKSITNFFSSSKK